MHYSEVAGALGVSAWTAYGLLRELERKGLAARSYEVPERPRLGGRSRILFAPRPSSPPPAELGERLRRVVERFAAVADGASALRAYLRETLQGGNGDLALHLGFWMARLEAAGRGASDAMRGVLESGAVPAAKIQTVAAMGLGSELSRLRRQRLAEPVVGAVTRLAARLEEAQRGSDTLLAALVEAARGLLAARTPSPGAPTP